MSADSRSSSTTLVMLIVISITVAGYFTGLQSPMNPVRPAARLTRFEHTEDTQPRESDVPPATSYSEMASLLSGRRPTTSLSRLKSDIDPLEEIRVNLSDKLAALTRREQNRAFNGAPPTIPHSIEQRSSASCVACHSEGFKTSSLRIPRMSHEYLANCTQCHIAGRPDHMPAVVFRENGFEGLPASQAGFRAFEGAPPQIPHSTWMRSDCMSCHGYAGLHGLRTSHPWRHNCLQCHAPSATLEQALLAVQPRFLPGPLIEN